MKYVFLLVSVVLLFSLSLSLLFCDGHPLPSHLKLKQPKPIAPVEPLTTSNDLCLGEFEYCPNSGSCVLLSSHCNICSVGQYLCPNGFNCVNGAEGYLNCPNMDGTIHDWNLSPEERIDSLLEQATQDEIINQLQNQAPAIERFSIPKYNWLNDDVHSVMKPKATVFPDGCGLGATWDRQSLFDVGYLIGNEARATHNGLVHEGDRGWNENGAGITTYAPNMNLVRDPRW
jgi:beta-glucosidase